MRRRICCNARRHGPHNNQVHQPHPQATTALLLTVRFTKHDALTLESPSRMLRQLLLRHCCGGALAHWLLRQHALKILGEAPWLQAQGETEGGTERSYGD